MKGRVDSLPRGKGWTPLPAYGGSKGGRQHRGRTRLEGGEPGGWKVRNSPSWMGSLTLAPHTF
jgi:hypothetical protein